ncbi:MAG: D-glycero-beta-D-manno-heptose 1,7-bisphosphate 7-phosphatase [Pseudomonadota bacterium]
MRGDGPLVILDRDGVINRDSDAFVKGAREWIPIDGSIDAIARLSNAGKTVTVATNQSGLGRKLFDRRALKRMHDKMHRLVSDAGGKISVVAFSPALPGKNDPFRKPRPGMLTHIAEVTGQTLTDAWMVGDSLRDLEAGQAVGCRLILVKTGKGEKTLRKIADDRPQWWNEVQVFDDLAAAADHILEAH